ncbi:restriction endonuclease subunit S [Acinetobacter variabilis]|uniref:restriction endonuclease subunit S n=1 Tax=Acinetobacter variabilis TaxID=70346 RepID=UPI003A8995DA
MAISQESIKVVHADECMDVRDGTHDSPKFIEKGVPFVTSKNLVNGKIDFSTCSFISDEDHEAFSKRSNVEDGDILYAMIGTIGNPVIVKKDRDFSIKNVALFKFNNSDVYNRYIYHFLNSEIAKKQLAKLSKGGTQKFVSLGSLRKLKIPLPPLAEQRRIASILDQADELRQKRQQAIEKLDQLLQATFIDMFGDPVSNPKGWEKVEVGKVTTCIVPGRDKPKSFTGSIPWITTDDLNSLGYTSQSKKRMGLTQTEIDDVRAKVIPFQSVVMSCVGNLGITSIANNEFVMNQQLHSYQCLEQITPEFLMFCLPFEKNYMFSRATSTTLPYMNKSVCNSVPVILPPIDLQEKWSKILLSIEEHKQSLYKQLDMQNQLFSALQNQAFNGTL